jgi:hypothetical protein
MNYLGEFFTVIFPTFAAFASLREIIRISVAASPRQALSGEQNKLNMARFPQLKLEEPTKHTK